MNSIHYISRFLITLLATIGLTTPLLWAADSQTVAVYGASGRIGEVIVDVALERGHKVIGLSRRPEKLQVEHENFTAKKGDLSDVESIRKLAKEVDAIIISVTAGSKDNRPENSFIVFATESIKSALSGIKDIPYIVQIGSASLMYGHTLEELQKNMTNVPFSFDKGTRMHGVIFGHQISYKMYRDSNLPWTIVAPPTRILGIPRNAAPDKTTTKGDYRTSTTGPLLDAEGNNTVYVRDLAIATINEVEQREFVGKVFTVAY